VRIAGVGSAFPPHYYDQDTLIAALRRAWGQRHYNLDRLEALHRNALVGGRHLALPLDEYPALTSWSRANDAWIRVARDVGEHAVRGALEAAGVGVDEVDAFFFVTVTGVSTPSLDALLMNRLHLPARVKRTPIFGLGCVAGAAGLARAADYVRAWPEHVAVLLSVELCSLTFQRDDLSVPNLIATGLFGDGAAAAIVVGDEFRPTLGLPAIAPRAKAGPSNGRSGSSRILASRSVFYPDSERVMGWDVSDTGFRIVLSAEVPNVVLAHMAEDVDAFLGDQGLTRRDIARWIAHPGGPKVLEAVQQALGLPDAALEASWRTLREVGNLSSTSVLLVLEEAVRNPPPASSYGVVVAMGPGFCSELVLLRW
jgi:alkylresorcinol/alkylpyrone synthase